MLFPAAPGRLFGRADVGGQSTLFCSENLKQSDVAMAQPSQGEHCSCVNKCPCLSLTLASAEEHWESICWCANSTALHRRLLCDVVVALMTSLQSEDKTRFGGISEILNFTVNSSQMNYLNIIFFASAALFILLVYY